MNYQVMYSSKATSTMGLSDLEAILSVARKHNESLDITGVLVYVDGVFLQVLEGDKEQVLKLINTIESDTRHDSVKVFYQADENTRAFDGWRMAHLDITREQMASWYDLEGTAPMDVILEDIQKKPAETTDHIRNMLSALAS